MKNKKDLKEIGKKIDEAMNSLEKKVDESVLPKIKGMEMPIMIAVLIMLLSAISLKMVILGAIVLAILMAPKYMDKILKGNEEDPKKKTKKESKEE